VTAIREGLRDPSAWTYLVDALDMAMHDDDASDLAWFAMIATDRDEDGTYAATSFGRSHLPISCADWPRSPWETAVPSADVLANHPLWARVEPFVPAECESWTGKERETLLVGAEPVTPVLVIGNEGDGVTPIEGTEMLAAAIIRSRFVRVEEDGHGAYAGDNDCANEVVDAYLARAIAPEPGKVCGAS
jgi:pimeloyl-ACP methyl ester carboxylesterase